MRLLISSETSNFESVVSEIFPASEDTAESALGNSEDESNSVGTTKKWIDQAYMYNKTQYIVK